MDLTQYLLLGILILLGLGAVIAFSYCVIKPLQTRWAVARAREIVAGKQMPRDWQRRNIHRMLATTHHDLEAASLWRKMEEMAQTPDNKTDQLLTVSAHANSPACDQGKYTCSGSLQATGERLWLNNPSRTITISNYRQMLKLPP